MADPGRGGVDLRHGPFSLKMYAKTKEFGPVGGVRQARPLDPPMISAIQNKEFTGLSSRSLIYKTVYPPLLFSWRRLWLFCLARTALVRWLFLTAHDSHQVQGRFSLK